MMHFETTRWSVVRAAASSQPSQARHALEALCRIYWYPIYAYIRRRGNCAEDAKDLTQEFFARILARDDLKSADPSKGRFRSFLLACVNHFLSNERDRRTTLKRGGAVVFLPLDFAALEQRYVSGAWHVLSPEKMFDRAWALATVESALSGLQREYDKAGKAVLFDRLKGTLTGQEERVPYRELGVALGLTEGAVKVAAHRLRQRYRQVLIDEITQTLAEGESVEEELKHLFSMIGA
ncbi:MAG: sigma-70 family RNA polymerase sigma factor [Candidatus Hydrogenedentes bacterium]|nr:sigma-70 family RNA polymerase sigma factor [Candidatus Hydrogenedentota bacterium]